MLLTAVISQSMAILSTSAPALAENKLDSEPFTIARQGSFFVGGREIKSDALSTIPQFSPQGTILVDQMYVHYQVPLNPKPYAVTLVHGCCLTGKSWETTPDGRMGWDEYFVRRGFSVYNVDQSWRGRSAASPVAVNCAKVGKVPADSLPAFISAGREGAWPLFRFGPEYPTAYPGLQFPIEAREEFWKQMVPDWNYSMTPPVPSIQGLAELSQRIQNTVLISHSQSGIYPFQTAAMSPKGIAGIISLEPGACPAPEFDMTNLKPIPILILFGDFVETSEAWSKRLQGCQSFVAAAKAAGVRAEVVSLPDVGLYGNSHMLMQDKNNLAVADWLIDWMSKRIGSGGSR
ncbi:esterase [Bradyrhizobium brasilense]|uniref:esterase n=1 Tax=Bradyrhizobium brasilense TaxID=1419277 RepID=UPI001E32A76B|nr:esterase [Bradyrhizobium brasilense]